MGRSRKDSACRLDDGILRYLFCKRQSFPVVYTVQEVPLVHRPKGVQSSKNAGATAPRATYYTSSYGSKRAMKEQSEPFPYIVVLIWQPTEHRKNLCRSQELPANVGKGTCWNLPEASPPESAGVFASKISPCDKSKTNEISHSMRCP